MQIVGGFHLPSADVHFAEFGEKLADYQKAQRIKALEYVKDFSLAIDVGAHVGIFSRFFAQRFEKVLAYEPAPALRECLEKNVPANVEIRPHLVSDHEGDGVIYQISSGNTGGSFILNDDRIVKPKLKKMDFENVIMAPTVTIDSLKLRRLGLIKVDVQGADHLVLDGARQTLLRCKPVIIVEEKPVAETGSMEHVHSIHRLMAALGATARERFKGDRIYTFG
jgi:FkbM family methyltransferase